MPRIRQYADRYAVDDFWKEIDRCCPLAGIQSDNASALGKRIGEGYQNLLNYQKGKTEMRVRQRPGVVRLCGICDVLCAVCGQGKGD